MIRLVLADDHRIILEGLEQLFRRPGTAVVQDIEGAAAFAPDGVKIFRAGIHGAVFYAMGGKVKAVQPPGVP